ncbi:hypothetical protein Dsin_014331 [Dipteronia sinensis]|uniref:DUF4220 domain-containing protein n=1 Tax=Dipteronia sinensis TaxID=43782 RepID=A0AAE0ALK7_9ROSI|nr:hypothetical protein Dsin_014331 [Dipteronia sinensis]
MREGKMQLFQERIINLWNKCEVRVIILLSLVLQIILIIFSNQRKLTNRAWIKIIVWSAYLSADWVATVALGNLASTIRDSEDKTPVPNNSLQEFWAPFLLLHLGGPDTITAYSLEDNELWLRHFLGLIIQVGVAFYVFLRSWGNTALTFLTIPIFISGVIKYGERTYALMSSSSEHFKDSLPSSPDSCQDFVKYVDDRDTRGKREEEEEEAMVIPQDGIHTEDHYLVLAYFLFNRTKYFFAERTLNDDERKRIYSIIITRKNAKEAFKLVEVELGFMYDVLYTKAAIVYSHLGIALRCITFFCSVCALVVFSTIVDTHVYQLTDVSLSYLLLVVAVLLELYALLVLFLSDWTKLWLIKFQNSQHNSLSKIWRLFSHSQSLFTSTKRWSESMGQYNILCSCLKKVQPTCIEVLNLTFIGKLLENKYLTWVDVNIDLLQEKILDCLKQRTDMFGIDASSYTSYMMRDLILRQRGNVTLTEKYNLDELTSEWCTVNVEFVDSLIIWHIATDICYCGDLDDDVDSKISKYLSDYMLYLLVFRPSMLPVGIGEIRLKETNDEIIQLLKKNKLHDTHNKSKACEALLQNYSDLLKKFSNFLNKYQKDADDDFNEFFKGESQSLLKYGLMVSTQLQNEPERKWKIISDVWVEMLVYAAHNCGWKQHAQQLRKGGELLTHVCLLMTHFSLTKQYVSTHLASLTPEVERF